MGEREPGADHGPAGGRAGDLAATAQLGGALPERDQADAGLGLRGDAAAVVDDLDEQVAFVAQQADGGAPGVRVPGDVGERLAGYAVGRDLDGGGQVPEVGGVDRHRESGV